RLGVTDEVKRVGVAVEAVATAEVEAPQAPVSVDVDERAARADPPRLAVVHRGRIVQTLDDPEIREAYAVDRRRQAHVRNVVVRLAAEGRLVALLRDRHRG